MKQRTHSTIVRLCLVGLVGFLCGCQGPQHAEPDLNADLPPKTQLKLVALAELNVPGKHADKNLGAYFVLVDEDELSFFQDYFKDNVPRVVLQVNKDQPYADLTRDAAGGAVDKVTGKPGLLIGFQKIEIKDDEARVELVESKSLSGINIHAFEMRRHKGKWMVVVHFRRAVL